MDKEEKYILDKCHRKEPFRVPEGYFDSLADTLMAKLPERQAIANDEIRGCKAIVVPFRRRFRAIAVAASATIVVGLSAMFYFNAGSAVSSIADSTQFAAHKTSTRYQASADVASDDVDGAIDEYADYTMMDNEDMYAYVSGY